MNSIIKIISTALFLFLLALNISLVNRNDSKAINILNLTSLEALAQSDSGESCFGDSFPLDRPKVASGLCWCNNQVIYSQTCTGSGNGCTEIQCDDL